MGATEPDAYQIAIRLLSYRWRSERELRERLTQKAIAAPEIDATIRRLTEEGWIDDERFARELVRSRARRHGRRRIGTDLRRFGVDDEVARQALAEELDLTREDELIRETAAKKIDTLARRHGNDYIASEVGRRKLARFLLNRGYPEAAVRKIVFELTTQHRDDTDSENEERDQ